MIQVIKIIPGVNGFAENKDEARTIRKDVILPSLERDEMIIIDFEDVKFATQSFIHALIGEPLKQYGDNFLDKIEFKNCSLQLQNVIGLVIDYSLGGFDKKE